MSLCPRDVGTDFGFHHSARDSPNRENTNTILALYLIAYITIIALGLFEVPLCRYNWRFFFYHFWEYVLSLPKLACYH